MIVISRFVILYIVPVNNGLYEYIVYSVIIVVDGIWKTIYVCTIMTIA